MSNSKPLPEFHDRAPPDRYCDLILTGGVTSALAYPAAIFTLAMAYRFHCIGGSSSGAGAAALAAAAEYRRRHGSPDGFRLLLEKTAALSESVDGQTKLAWLFQPQKKTARLFEVLVSIVEVTDTERWWTLVKAVFKSYWWAFIVGIAIGVAVVLLLSVFLGPQGIVAFVVTGLLFGIAAVPTTIYCDVRHGLLTNHFGLCNGKDPAARAPHAALVPWLHSLIQEIAGRTEAEPPLTFGDLWDAPGWNADTRAADPAVDAQSSGWRSIDLKIFSANVTHGRPYLLPDQDQSSRLFFVAQELEEFFPSEIIAHLQHYAIAYKPINRGDPPAGSNTKQYMELPSRHLPIVVAARLSVGFPILFSAVPLYAIDYELPRGQRDLKKCLFADGSVCSNFPIHLFDRAFPAWPTFGISLSKASPHWECPEDRVWLPEHHDEGRSDSWTRFNDDALLGFLGALLSTALNWNDATLARMPGVRDRIARIGLKDGEGGLNIRMTKEKIEQLAEWGGEAAKKLLEKFSTASSRSGLAWGWNDHRWLRFNLLRNSLKECATGLASSASSERYAQPLREQIRAAMVDAPLHDDERSRLVSAEAAALEGLLEAFEQLERALTTQAVDQPYTPMPRPVLRTRPPL